MEELKNLNMRARVIFYIFLIPLIISYCILSLSLYSDYGYLGFLVSLPYLLIVLAILIGILTRKNSKLNKTYKIALVLPELNKRFEEVQFFPNLSIPKQHVIDSELFEIGTGYFGNDYISGKYKNVNFLFSNLSVEYNIHYNDGDRHREIIFNGQFFVCNLPNKLNSIIKVYEKTYKNFNSIKKMCKNIKKIKIGDELFDKHFVIYSDNEIELLTVLNPNVINKITMLGTKVKGKILFCFKNDKLYIGIYNNRNMFEYNNPLKKININKEQFRTNEQLDVICELLDVFDLNFDLFNVN